MPDCQPLVDDLVSYMQGTPPPTYFNVVIATLSIHQSSGLVSYCPPGDLIFRAGDNPVFVLNSYQYFSDRVKQEQHLYQPFNEEQKDSITLNIYTNPVRVEIILRSWGNGSSFFDPLSCDGNFLYSINPGGYLMGISFQKTIGQSSL